MGPIQRRPRETRENLEEDAEEAQSPADEARAEVGKGSGSRPAVGSSSQGIKRLVQEGILPLVHLHAAAPAVSVEAERLLKAFCKGPLPFASSTSSRSWPLAIPRLPFCLGEGEERGCGDGFGVF